MAKYDPLRRYLRRQTATELELTFSEIENLLTDLLPKSAARAQWWANEVSPESSHVQCRAWLGAGYEAFLIAGRDRVRFRRRA
jgi:hypothetical protein